MNDEEIQEEIERLEQKLRAIQGGRRFGGLKDDIKELKENIEEKE
jgi:peptidoglycan hydrolase CwlO-like protein